MLVLSHALCGDLDGSAVRYMLVQSCLVEAVTWVAPTQTPIFLAHLYPFLGVCEMQLVVLSGDIIYYIQRRKELSR